MEDIRKLFNYLLAINEVIDLSDLENGEEESAIRSLLLQLVDSMISSGKIDPNGKSHDLLIKESLEIWEESNKEIKLADDSLYEIEKKANEFRKNGELYFSVIFCALWFEHWINLVILKRSIQQGLSEKNIYSVIRETNSKAKTNWLLKLLNLPLLNENQVKCINHIIELRNSYIHYKWNSILLEEDGSISRYENAIDSFLRMLIELKEYEINYIYKGYDRYSLSK